MLKSLMRRRAAGFTLVELMIVVAIIGILAALAIYGVSRYLKHSKTAEATRNLGSIEVGEKNAFQQETPVGAALGQTFVHAFCATTTASPLAWAAGTGNKVTPNQAGAADFQADVWKCVKFNVTEPVNYQYSVNSNGAVPPGLPAGIGTLAAYTATARGDLDGNGTTSLYQLIGTGGRSGDASRVTLLVTNDDE